MPGTPICDDRSITHHHARLDLSHKTSPSRPRTLPLSILLLGLIGGLATPAAARDHMDDAPSQPVLRSTTTPVLDGAIRPGIADQPAPGAPTAPASPPAAAAPVPAASASLEPTLSTAEVVIGRGDTLMKILQAQAIPDANRQAVLAAISDIFDPASLQVGAHLRFTLMPVPDRPVSGNATAKAGSPQRVIQMVELIANGSTTFTIHVDDDSMSPAQAANAAAKPQQSGVATTKPGIWIAANGQQQDAGVQDSGAQDTGEQFVVRRAAGVVGRNFRATLQAEKLPAPLIDEIMIGFKAGSSQRQALPQNAAYEVIYEGVLTAGKMDQPQLRYAMIDDNGKTRRIYRYQTDDATTALMQDDGHGVALIDLGRPLQIDARITSPFGWRIHPVFGDRRFHEGVDFGAPTGTPVIATSDGVIEDIGWRGNYGDYIRLRHDDHLATAYAHLSSFARGLKRGSTVKRGDVIAYVGRTGVATGPHLYYEVLVDGKQIDPMKTPPAVPLNLTGAQLAEFQKFVETTPEE